MRLPLWCSAWCLLCLLNFPLSQSLININFDLVNTFRSGTRVLWASTRWVFQERSGILGTRPSSPRLISINEMVHQKQLKFFDPGTVCCCQHFLFTEASLHFLSQSIPWAFTSINFESLKQNILTFLLFFQVILSRMILDICKFCFLYLLVLFAFSCGKKWRKKCLVNKSQFSSYFTPFLIQHEYVRRISDVEAMSIIATIPLMLCCIEYIKGIM